MTTTLPGLFRHAKLQPEHRLGGPMTHQGMLDHVANLRERRIEKFVAEANV
jgi:hypothetical protein